MTTFYNTIQQYNWDETREKIYNCTSADVERALAKQTRNLNDFMALISPVAAPYLEQMASLSRQLTLKRFGKTMQLYLPLYLSNECINSCVYCGFNHANKITRKTLTLEEVENEANAICAMGYEHLLLVTGEHPKKSGGEYLVKVMDLLKDKFSQLSVEVQPLQQNEYERLIKHGLNAVYVYQETCNEANYKKYHPRGPKSDYRYRLETPDRLGRAGIYKTGLGCLLGLEDWRTDSFFTALHLSYLEQNYWRTRYSISFPRLRPHAGSFNPENPITDKELAQLIFAYRIFNEEVEISLSTRELPAYRDHMMHLGVTSMSAGSKTEPGGYAVENKELEQFEVGDARSVEEIRSKIIANGYEPVWKDWDAVLQG
jgi:2-iminoacetate synthase